MPKSAERSVAVVIPSRLDKSENGRLFIEDAIEAASAQVVAGIRMSFFVGIDADAIAPAFLDRLPNVNFIRSHGRSQAAAINAAAAAAAGEDQDIVALLEDDDRWEANFLSWSLSFLEECDFVSSNQLEVDTEGQCVRVNDFPTPSGWIMSADLWRSVGPFDESFRWHLDNEWLGRLGAGQARRIHLVEATAPITVESCAQVRPWLANVLTHGGPHSTLRRHLSSRPLLRRMVHRGSGMFRIATDPVAAAQSRNEYLQLAARYGRVPW